MARTPVKSRVTQTAMAPSAPMMPWRLFMDHSILAPLPSSVQMELNYWLTRSRSWRDRLNAWIRSSTILLKSMARQSGPWQSAHRTRIPKGNETAKAPQSLLRCTKQVAQPWCRETDRAIPVYVEYRKGPTTAKRCQHSPKERQSPVLWQSPRYFSPLLCWQDLDPHPAQPPHPTSCSVFPSRKPVWFPLRTWICRHDICCTPAPGKKPTATSLGPSLTWAETAWKDNWEVWLSERDHNDRPIVSWLHDEETIQKPFQWWTAWNKAAFSLRRSSVQYSPPWWLVPSMTARLDYRADTGLTAGCSTLGAWRLFQRWRRLSSETSCLLMTVPSTPAQSRWCSTKCTVYTRLWQLRSYHQHPKNWSHVSACIWKALPGITYYG